MGEKKILTGNKAVALGAKLCRLDMAAVYPITPQTQIAEEISNLENADIIHVESEHSAMAAVYGASLAGGRAFTATSSHGLLYMYEMLYWSAGARVPIVLVNVTRSLGSPWNIWADHNDAMLLRDFPAIQLFAGSCQEAHDLMPIAYRLAEETLFLTIVNIEGFMLSHSGEPVEIMEQEKVDSFLPPLKMQYKIDIDDPRTFGASSDTPDFFFEFRRQAYAELKCIIENKFIDIATEFYEKFGRYHGTVESYLTEDAETILVTLGTVFDTAKIAVDELRKRDEKIGVLKIRLFRPLPELNLFDKLLNKDGPKKIVVIENNNTMVVTENIRSRIQRWRRENPPVITGFVAGIGGKEITPETIKRAVELNEQYLGADLWEGKMENGIQKIVWECGDGR